MRSADTFARALSTVLGKHTGTKVFEVESHQHSHTQVSKSRESSAQTDFPGLAPRRCFPTYLGHSTTLL
jgi:hypothetical protein